MSDEVKTEDAYKDAQYVYAGRKVNSKGKLVYCWKEMKDGVPGDGYLFTENLYQVPIGGLLNCREALDGRAILGSPRSYAGKLDRPIVLAGVEAGV